MFRAATASTKPLLLTRAGARCPFWPSPRISGMLHPRHLSSFDRDDDFDPLSPEAFRQANSQKRGGNNKDRKLQNKRRKTWEFRDRFVDKIRLQCAGGTGGRGCTSQANINNKLKPDGGHGGAGGSVLLVAHQKVQTLQMSRKHIQARHGQAGQSQDQQGRSARNTIVQVPCGVVVKRILDYGDEWDEENQRVVGPNFENNNNIMEDYNREVVDNSKLDLGRTLRDVDQNQLWEQDGKFFWKRGTAPDGEDEDFNEQEENDEDHEEDEEEDYDENEDEDMDYRNAKLEKMLGGKTYGGYMLLSPNDIDDDPDDEEEESVDMGDRPTVTLADLDVHGSHILVARGGRGGTGTTIYAKTHRNLRPDEWVMSRNASPELGEVVHLELELKLIADIGLVGFPNAGKSSLLRAMSRAAPKVAPYPFTTLHPLMGVIEYQDGLRIRAADIPGLIGGASEGRGMGHEFLRHIERTKALLYIVDAPGTDGRDPLQDLRILANELGSYGEGDLLERRVIVMANKTDLMDPDAVPDMLASLAEVADELGLNRDHNVQGVSAGVTGEGLGGLSKIMRDVVEKANKDSELALAATMAEMKTEQNKANQNAN